MNRYSKLLLLVTLSIFCSLVYAGPTKKYGKSLTLKKTTPISAIIDAPEKYKGKRLLVEGTIVDVCTKRGCWIEIGGDKEFQSIRFKVEDGIISFPVEAKGKKVRAEGVLSVETASEEELIEQGKKHAKETGETFDPSTVTGPEIYIQLDGLGAEIK